MNTPKGSHHDHIDGSVAAREYAFQLYELTGEPKQVELVTGEIREYPTEEAMAEFFSDEAVEIVDRFKAVNQVLQTKDALKAMGYEYGKRRAEEGWEYVEAIFGPQYHTFGGLTLQEVSDAMTEGLWKAEDEFKIRIVPRIGIGREADPELGKDLARVALHYAGDVMLDLVCDEAEHPPEKHYPAYKLTFNSPVPRSVHAGEWAFNDPQYHPKNNPGALGPYSQLTRNVWTAIRTLKADSIGHGIPVAHNPDLLEVMAGEGIRLEGNPLSNESYLTGIRQLGIDRILDAGVAYTLNADDDLFLPTLPEVWDRVMGEYDFSEAERQILRDNVFSAALGMDPDMYRT